MRAIQRVGPIRIWTPLLAMLLACRESSLGPCTHTYRDRILHLTRVIDATTGQSLSTVFLDSLTYQEAFGQAVAYLPNPFVDLRVSRRRCRPM